MPDDNQQQQQQQQQEQTPQTPEWLSSLSDDHKDLKSNTALASIADVGTLAKRFAGAIELPGADAKPEERDAALDKIANQLGRPEKPEAYKVPEIKDRPYTDQDKALQGQFLPLAHKARMTQDQVNVAVGFFNDLVVKGIEHQTKVAGETEAALRKQYGDKFDGALEVGNRAIAAVLQKAGIDGQTWKQLTLADGSFAGDNPLMCALAIGIGEVLAETKFVKGDSTNTPTEQPLSEQVYPSMNKKE